MTTPIDNANAAIQASISPGNGQLITRAMLAAVLVSIMTAISFVYTSSQTASNITTGTLPASVLPTPTPTTLGGVKSGTASANQFQTGIDTNGNPVFGGISGITGAYVATNAALLATPSTSFSRVQRGGFTTAGDQGAAYYVSSSSPCPLNAGAGDNGSQVKSSDGNCWLIDVKGSGGLNPYQFGAVGNDVNDDTVAIQNESNAAIALKVPLTFGQASVAWKITSKITIDYFPTQSVGWSINANDAYFDANSITSGVAFAIYCGGTAGSKNSSSCVGLHIRGPMRVLCSSINDFCFQLGHPDLRDVIQGAIIDKLVSNNNSNDPRAGGCQLNYPTTDDMFVVCDTNGGAINTVNNSGYTAGRAIVGASMNLFRGAATAAQGAGDLVADSTSSSVTTNTGNTWINNDYEVGPVAIAVTAQFFYANTFVSPFTSNPQAFSIPSGNNHNGNTIISPTVTTSAGWGRGTAYGVGLVGFGSLPYRYIPYGRLYTPQGLDCNSVISSANGAATGTDVTVYPVALQAGVNTINFTSTSGVLAGDVVSGSGIAGGTVVSSVNTTTVTLSANTTGYAGPSIQYVTFTHAGGTTTQLLPTPVFGTVLNVTSASSLGLSVGENVAGLGLPAATITAIGANTVTISSAATGYSGYFYTFPVRFFPAAVGGGDGVTTTTYALPDGSTLNGAGTAASGCTMTFVSENSNPITLTTNGSQRIVVDGTSLSSLVLPVNGSQAQLTWTGSLWTADTTPGVASANGLYGTAKTAWTPVLNFGGTAATATVTGSNYFKTGNIVTAEIVLTLTAKNGTGSATITGLPFAANSTGNMVCSRTTNTASVSSTLIGYISGSTINLGYQVAAGISGVTDANFGTPPSSINCTATYLAAT